MDFPYLKYENWDFLSSHVIVLIIFLKMPIYYRDCIGHFFLPNILCNRIIFTSYICNYIVVTSVLVIVHIHKTELWLKSYSLSCKSNNKKCKLNLMINNL